MKTTKPRIVLTSMGHYFPSTVLDNDFFDKLDIGSDAEWINDRVGIHERRSVLRREDIVRLRRGETTRAQLIEEGKVPTMASMAKECWSMAVQRAGTGFSPEHIDGVIAGTSVPDWDIPANACSIAGTLGLSCMAFDVNSACSTFVVNLHVARTLMESGTAKSMAIFNAERYTTRVDYRDRASCVLFGDSAAAAILESRPGVRGLELIDTVVHSDPGGYEHVRLPDSGVFSQNGKAVQKFAVTKTVAVTHEILERNGLKQTDISYFIAHQANLRMLASACEKNGITPEQHLYNVDTRGNQGATGAPSVLSTHWERYKPGDIVVMSVVGSGLTWAAAVFKAC